MAHFVVIPFVSFSFSLLWAGYKWRLAALPEAHLNEAWLSELLRRIVWPICARGNFIKSTIYIYIFPLEKREGRREKCRRPNLSRTRASTYYSSSGVHRGKFRRAINARKTHVYLMARPDASAAIRGACTPDSSRSPRAPERLSRCPMSDKRRQRRIGVSSNFHKPDRHRRCNMESAMCIAHSYVRACGKRI